MSPLPSGAVTFLFTDIEGSTPLWEREPERMRLALERHHAILRTAIEAHGGHVYKVIGDAFQAAFAIPTDAVEAALAAQRELAAEGWPTSIPIRVRMGLHTGQARAEESDYATTHTLNRAARIMSAGHFHSELGITYLGLREALQYFFSINLNRDLKGGA